MKKIIIVGGVAGGATAAARLRRLDEEAQIVLFERDEYISFANCGLPYYIGGVIRERDKLLVQTVEGMSERFALDVRNLSEVVSVNRERKTVTVFDKKKQETYEETYDTLILSPGAKPIRPPIPGLEEADSVFVLRNIPDTDRIKDYVTGHAPKTAAVIGGGFIGIEMAENLRELGVRVTVVEKLPQVLRPLDFEMAQFVHQELGAHGVELVLGDGISEFKEKGHVVRLESGREIGADMVVLAIGVAPENTLAKSAGLALGPRGHIRTNPHMQTLDATSGETVNEIYAIGDAVEVRDRIDGSATAIPLAWPANRQGRLVADHICGLPAEYGGSLGTAVAKVFDLTVASTGNNEAQLKMKNIPYRAIHAHRANHASYYPGAVNIALKLLYSPDDGKILGAQAVGRDGTEKRIDVIATVIRLGGTVRELSDLELSYAPPYSSAKDPVNILGYIAGNAMDGTYDFVHWNEIDDIVKNGGFLLDVRTPIEFAAGHVEGAVNIPVDELRQRIGEITAPTNKPIYVTCQVGLRAHVAVMLLRGRGYEKIYNLSGGWLTYKTAHYEPRAVQHETPPALPVDTDNQTVEAGAESGQAEPLQVDARGLQCPGPLMATYRAVKNAAEGDRIRIFATDYGFAQDIENWCRSNGHEMLSLDKQDGGYSALIRKGAAAPRTLHTQENATIVVFSGELDRTLASMIIAQGAAAGGKKVTLFFTFWGLNVLRRKNRVKVKKNFVERMFGSMMPRGAAKMPLSAMNMMGMGPAMIKGIMKKKNVDDVDRMIANAREAGVRFVACTMSMDLMGIKKEELIEGVELGGVATYISSNENAGTTLFI